MLDADVLPSASLAGEPLGDTAAFLEAQRQTLLMGVIAEAHEAAQDAALAPPGPYEPPRALPPPPPTPQQPPFQPPPYGAPQPAPAPAPVPAPVPATSSTTSTTTTTAAGAAAAAAAACVVRIAAQCARPDAAGNVFARAAALAHELHAHALQDAAQSEAQRDCWLLALCVSNALSSAQRTGALAAPSPRGRRAALAAAALAGARAFLEHCRRRTLYAAVARSAWKPPRPASGVSRAHAAVAAYTRLVLNSNGSSSGSNNSSSRARETPWAVLFHALRAGEREAAREAARALRGSDRSLGARLDAWIAGGCAPATADADEPLVHAAETAYEQSRSSSGSSDPEETHKRAVLNLVTRREFEGVGALYEGVLRDSADVAWYQAALLAGVRAPAPARVAAYAAALLAAQRALPPGRVCAAFQTALLALRFGRALRVLAGAGPALAPLAAHVGLVLYMCQLTTDTAADPAADAADAADPLAAMTAPAAAAPVWTLVRYVQQQQPPLAPAAAAAYVSLLATAVDDWLTATQQGQEQGQQGQQGQGPRAALEALVVEAAAQVAAGAAAAGPLAVVDALWLARAAPEAARLRRRVELRAAALCEGAGSAEWALQLRQRAQDSAGAARLLLRALLPLARGSPGSAAALAHEDAAQRLLARGTLAGTPAQLLAGACAVAQFYRHVAAQRWAAAVQALQAAPIFPFALAHDGAVTVADYPPELVHMLPDILQALMQCLAALWTQLKDAFFNQHTVGQAEAERRGRAYQTCAQQVLDFASSLELHLATPLREQLFQEVISLVSARI